MRHYRALLLATIGSYCLTMHGHYPYYAPQSLSYHRYERERLFTTDINVLYGSCDTARTYNKEKTNILGMYDREQLHQVGKNITNQDINTLHSLMLDALWHVVPTDDTYGTMDFTGSFSSLNGVASLGYNITESFFINLQVPFYKIEVKNPTVIDSTSTAASTIEWTTVVKNLDAILKDAQLSLKGYSSSGVGDIKCAFGWARNVDELGQLFALDSIIQLGVVIGSAEEQDISKVFAIAPGNNKHTAFFFNFDTHIGVNEHLTFSLHTEQTVFLKRDCIRRVRTAEGQNGWIKLSSAKVEEEWGNKYALGGYVTYNPADWMAFSTGYTYYHQNKHILTPEDGATYSSSIINNDAQLKPWSSHTWHIVCEINGAHQDRKYHPRIALSYNRIIGSHNTFLNHTASGSLGLSITADF